MHRYFALSVLSETTLSPGVMPQAITFRAVRAVIDSRRVLPPTEIIKRDCKCQIDSESAVARITFALPGLRPILNHARSLPYQTSLPQLPRTLQTRRRVFRRRHSGKRYGDRVHDSGRLHDLADGDWFQL